VRILKDRFFRQIHGFFGSENVLAGKNRSDNEKVVFKVEESVSCIRKSGSWFPFIMFYVLSYQAVV
jgi:hypothetical protein